MNVFNYKTNVFNIYYLKNDRFYQKNIIKINLKKIDGGRLTAADWRRPIDGDCNYNLLPSLLYKIFNYFSYSGPYSHSFEVIFVNSSFAFTTAFVSQNFCEYGSTVLFRVQIRLRKLDRFVFGETQKSRNSFLLHCLTITSWSLNGSEQCTPFKEKFFLMLLI